MKATGADGETRFVPSIDYKKLLPAQPETVYFNKIAYPRLESSTLEEPLSFGLSDRSRFGPSVQDDDLFTVTFTPSKNAYGAASLGYRIPHVDVASAVQRPVEASTREWQATAQRLASQQREQQQLQEQASPALRGPVMA